MLDAPKTHREILKPEISIRYLADYMAAMSRGGHRSGRRIIDGCKYRPIGRIVQHSEAQVTLSKLFALQRWTLGRSRLPLRKSERASKPTILSGNCGITTPITLIGSQPSGPTSNCPKGQFTRRDRDWN